MKISLAVLLVAFLLFASLDQEMAKTLATTKPNQVVDRLPIDLKNNLGRKVNLGAVNGIGKDNDISTAEEEKIVMKMKLMVRRDPTQLPNLTGSLKKAISFREIMGSNTDE